MPRLFERVTIAGVGLIGGSLALAARQAGLVGEITGLGRSVANLEIAKERGVVDSYTHDPLAAARDADLLLLAVPVRSLAAVAAACAPALPSYALVSDVGSVKSTVLRDVVPVLPPGVSFVGAHPIAGTEDSGAAAARADLFRGSRCILTRSASSTPLALEKMRALWEGVGMRVDEMDADDHDRILAYVSHLPHAIAFSVVNAVIAMDGSMAQFAGPSFRDMTRIAASSPDTWRDIFFANRVAVEATIDGFISQLTSMRAALQDGDEARLTQILGVAQQARRAWSASG